MPGLQTVYKEMIAFFQPLWPGKDKPLVLGEGKEESPVLMLVGEAPGETEVLKRRPFVGKAGKNLDEFLTLARLNREDIFVTNAVKIRPTEKGPTGRTRNRAPNKEELSLFVPWLIREIQAVRPRALVTLGNVPLKALAGGKYSVGGCHGQWLKSEAGVPLFALYHPASIIYRRTLAPVYVQDVLTLADALKTNPSFPE
ncbi:MAG: uracil-DNA glycosylase [Clostridia bacterium]|nr:uracil-DNA glycosylase [Clostridia bacterium]